MNNWKEKQHLIEIKTSTLIEKFNQNHDDAGRFTTADNNTTGKGGGAGKGGASRTQAERKAHNTKLRNRGNVKIVEMSRPPKPRGGGRKSGEDNFSSKDYVKNPDQITSRMMKKARQVKEKETQKWKDSAEFKDGKIIGAGKSKSVMIDDWYSLGSDYRYSVKVNDKQATEIKSLKKIKSKDGKKLDTTQEYTKSRATFYGYYSPEHAHKLAIAKATPPWDKNYKKRWQSVEAIANKG